MLYVSYLWDNVSFIRGWSACPPIRRQATFSLQILTIVSSLQATSYARLATIYQEATHRRYNRILR